MLILALLAAVPVGLAVALTGRGGGRVPGGGQLAGITLQLADGADGGTVTACGNTHHYRSYPADATIHFLGLISPPGHWSVSLKLKSCYGGTFQSAGTASAEVSRDGSYHGSFPAPIGGHYYARAEILRAGALVTRSSKRYFEIR